MTTWYRARFLFCAFGPLYFLLAVGLCVQHNWVNEGFYGADMVGAAIAMASFVISVAVFLRLQAGFSHASPSRLKVEGVESLDENVLGYMLSYIPPLMIDDLGAASKVAPAVVFYAVLIVIMIRTEAMYINPYFLLFKYRLFRIELASRRAVVVITKKPEIISGEILTLHEIQPSKLYFAAN